MSLLRRIAPFLAVVFVAMVASLAVQHYVSQSSTNTTHELCLATNRGRTISNQRIVSEVTMRNVLINFANEASTARAAAYAVSHQPSDLLAAQQYAADAVRLQNIPFPLLPHLKC